MRYLVERKRDDFESVGADTFEIGASGDLKFFNLVGQFQTEFVFAFASGQWITLCVDEAE